MKTKTLVIVGVGLGLWWIARRATANAEALMASRPVATLNGVGEVVHLKRPIGSGLASRIGTVTNTQGLGGLMDAEDIGDKDFQSLAPLNPDGSESFQSLPLVEQTRMRGVGRGRDSRADALVRSTVPADANRPRSDLRGGFSATPKAAWKTQDRIGQGPRTFRQLSLIERTQVRQVTAARTPEERLFRSTVPADPGRNATTVPWWAKHEILNATSPADPYHLQPVDRDGNAINIGQESPFLRGKHGEVTITKLPDEIDHVAEPIDPNEPGDPSYGTGTTTQYGDNDDQTYDPEPGSELGLLSDAG